MNNQQTIREEITTRIVDSLKNGKVPWRRPWASDKNCCGNSRNIVSKKAYRGINPFLLEISRMDSGHRCQWWGTYKQFKELGGQVKKGEKGTKIVFWKILEKEADADGKVKKLFFIRYYTVFNLDQVEGGEKLEKFRPTEEPEGVSFGSDDAFKAFDEVITATKADIRFGGNKAYYKRPIGAWPKHKDGDYIYCPNRRQFPDIRDWYDTLLHELAHWSEIRLKWEGKYAMGELIAEIAACFIPPSIGLPVSENMENHNRYLASWLEKMKDDPKFIFKAASQAQKVSDFVLHFSHPEIEWKEEKEKE